MEELAKYYIGTDDDPNYRKERIPQDIFERSIETIQQAGLSANQLQPIIDSFMKQGIHGIYDEINNPARSIAKTTKTAA